MIDDVVNKAIVYRRSSVVVLLSVLGNPPLLEHRSRGAGVEVTQNYQGYNQDISHDISFALLSRCAAITLISPMLDFGVPPIGPFSSSTSASVTRPINGFGRVQNSSTMAL